jgi:hypothetical protein
MPVETKRHSDKNTFAKLQQLSVTGRQWHLPVLIFVYSAVITVNSTYRSTYSTISPVFVDSILIYVKFAFQISHSRMYQTVNWLIFIGYTKVLMLFDGRNPFAVAKAVA